MENDALVNNALSSIKTLMLFKRRYDELKSDVQELKTVCDCQCCRQVDNLKDDWQDRWKE